MERNVTGLMQGVERMANVVSQSLELQHANQHDIRQLSLAQRATADLVHQLAERLHETDGRLRGTDERLNILMRMVDDFICGGKS